MSAAILAVDDADAEHTEAALARIFVALWTEELGLQAAGRHRDPDSSPIKDRLTAFAARAARALVRAARVSVEHVAPAVETAMATVSTWVDKVVRDTTATYRDTVPSLEDLQRAAEGVSRQAVTYTREVTRSETAQRSGLLVKTWHTQGDARVRPSHAELRGKTQKVGTPFRTITGAYLRFPGDPQAPLDETMGCRCRLAYSRT